MLTLLQAKSAEARKHVESGTLTVAGQTEVLNPHDIQEVCACLNVQCSCCVTLQQLYALQLNAHAADHPSE